MFVMTKQAVLFRRPDGETFRAPNGYVGAVPDWVAETKQFKRQVAAGKFVASQTSKDKDMEDAEKAGKKAEKKDEKKKNQVKPQSGDNVDAPDAETEGTAEAADKATEE